MESRRRRRDDLFKEESQFLPDPWRNFRLWRHVRWCGALKRAGFVEDRQKGGHLILIHPATKARTVVPIHVGRTIKAPLLRAIIRDASLSLDEFIELL